jgi:hypothetical protein
MVWERLGSASVSSSLANNSWKELDRVTLTSSGDTLDTGTFTAKDNIMILEHKIPSGSTRSKYQFNGDTGSNYSERRNDNGGSDGTSTSLTNFQAYHSGGTAKSFSVHSIINNSSQEKLAIGHIVENNADGSGNVPHRQEFVGKWANTSAQINRVKLFNDGSGSFDTGSELVVLGYDNDEADSGTNFWQELGSTELTSAGDDVTVSFTAKKYLMVEAYMVGGSGNNFRNAWKLNGTSSGSTYAYRKSSNGGSDNTYTSRNLLEIGDQDQTHDSYQKLFIVNVAGKEKLGIMEAVREENDSNSEPSRTEAVFKWATTSGQITSITAHNDQSGNFGVGSYVKVYGAD